MICDFSGDQLIFKKVGIDGYFRGDESTSDELDRILFTVFSVRIYRHGGTVNTGLIGIQEDCQRCFSSIRSDGEVIIVHAEDFSAFTLEVYVVNLYLVF